MCTECRNKNCSQTEMAFWIFFFRFFIIIEKINNSLPHVFILFLLSLKAFKNNEQLTFEILSMTSILCISIAKLFENYFRKFNDFKFSKTKFCDVYLMFFLLLYLSLSLLLSLSITRFLLRVIFKEIKGETNWKLEKCCKKYRKNHNISIVSFLLCCFLCLFRW